MMHIRIRKQLEKAGANKSEARELAKLAAGMHNAVPHLSAERKAAIANEIGFKTSASILQRRVAMAGAFAAVVLTVWIAQASNPGSPLYALKRGTEKVRVMVQPSFKQDLVDRRKDELEDLKKSNASDTSIRHAEDDLNKTEHASRSGSTSNQSGRETEEAEDRDSGSQTSGNGTSSNSGAGSTSGGSDSQSTSGGDSSGHSGSGSGNSGSGGSSDDGGSHHGGGDH